MRPLLLLPVLSCLAFAEEGSGHHLRVGLQTLPRDVEMEATATIAGTEVSASSDERWDSAGRLTLGYQWTLERDTPVSFILGGGLALSSFTVEDDDSDAEFVVSEFGLYVEPGVSWRPTRVFDLEVGLRLGTGVADGETKGGGADIDFDPAGYGEAALHVRPLFHFENGFEVGADLSLFAQQTTLEPEDGEVEYQFTTTGAAIGVVLGWRL